MITILKKTSISLLLINLCHFAFSASDVHTHESTSFIQFKNEIAQEAKSQGIRPDVIEKYLIGQTLNQKNIHQRNKYHKKLITHSFVFFKQEKDYHYLVKKGQQLTKQYQKQLKQIQQRYGVPESILIAIWGKETRFGHVMGNKNLINSLLSLSYYPSSQQHYYHRQLLAALTILNQSPHIMPEQLQSTYDGGMGHNQMEPETYLEYAVSFSKKSFPNIWTNPVDSLASTANYLAKHHWQAGENWGSRVKWKTGNRLVEKNYKQNKSGAFWKKIGIKSRYPLSDKQNYILYIPTGMPKNQGFLLGKNFKALMTWNASHQEMLHIAQLSDTIVNR